MEEAEQLIEQLKELAEAIREQEKKPVRLTPEEARENWKIVWREYRKALHGRLNQRESAIFALGWDYRVDASFSLHTHPIDANWFRYKPAFAPWRSNGRLRYAYVHTLFYRRCERKPGMLQGIKRLDRIHELRAKFPDRKALKI